MFHVNDIRNYQICRNLFAKNQTAERINYRQYIRMDEAMSIVAAKKLGIGEAFFGQRGDDNERTRTGMETNEWLIKARFEYHSLRVKIPFMHRVTDGYDVYFTRNELYPKEDNLPYITYTLWVLHQLAIRVVNIYVIHFNADYQRAAELDYDQMLVISAALYNHHNHPTYQIKDLVAAKMRDLTPLLDEMMAFDPKRLKTPRREGKCNGRYRCRFYEECFPEEAALSDNSILLLLGASARYKMYDQGIRRLADADTEVIEGTRQQYAQIMADRNGGLFVDKLNLRLWLKDNIRLPLAFLDFEWDRYAIPPYPGMKPFDVLLFQYSLHIYDGQQLEHREFIGVEDCRRELLEKLLADLPESGAIIAFNTLGGEELRLRELQEQFPEYAEQIAGVIARLVDFSIPFNLGMVYHLKMHGYYSLKKIIEAVDEHFSYRNLDISQAMMAVDGWRKLSEDPDDEADQKLLDDLLAYCAMDTYSLYLIYQWFIQISGLED